MFYYGRVIVTGETDTRIKGDKIAPNFFDDFDSRDPVESFFGEDNE